jgi:hypothetical protein
MKRTEMIEAYGQVLKNIKILKSRSNEKLEPMMWMVIQTKEDMVKAFIENLGDLTSLD